MPLTVVRRKSTGALTISGSVRLTDGNSVRVQRRAASNSLTVARQEASVLEAEILRNDWHGERADAHTLDEGIVKYLEAKPRGNRTKIRLERLRTVLGGATSLAAIDQDTITQLRCKMFHGTSEATVLREAITPLRAVLTLAAKRKLCDAPDFETPTTPEGRVEFFLPDEAERMLAAAATHLQPQLAFLFCTGARLSEALYLDWRDVDLKGGRVILWPDRTKARKRRNISLPPRAVAALANLPHREGMVFRRDDGEPYAEKDDGGGQIKTAWRGARERAGLRAALTPHTCRHTYATWHYALHKDLLRLKLEGGWASTILVERYAHLMPGGYEDAILEFRGECTGQLSAVEAA